MITRTILACSQLCIYAAVRVRFDQNNQNKKALHRDVPELHEADLTNLTHRKDLNCFRETEGETAKNIKSIVQVSQDAGFSVECGKGQYFGDQTLNQKRRAMDTGTQRVCTTLQ